ncbi:MAG: hypothetical protein A2Y10_07405 [Planctomycetes bacterium GWF2_41_51]|nr:MAG: hypothetical protein A2Y10_07405 [Planctomycetes bacterium GWF2_41_51]HBG27182.1 hypothetical protein [Phycisphaerales bacterium]
MAEIEMPHPMHEKHLCFLTNLGLHNTNTPEYKNLVMNPKFMCESCGRVADNEKNLCKPIKL